MSTTFLRIAGLAVFVIGLVFMGQGSRFFPYPASSFMVGTSKWIYIGGAIALAGASLFVLSWRSSPPISRR